MFETWSDCLELMETRILRQEPIIIQELLPKVRHLPLPWDSEEPIKSFLRNMARECAEKHDIELFFLRGRSHYAVSRDELVKLLRQHEARLRSQGKRFAAIAYKIQKRSKRKHESTQMEFNWETGSINAPPELFRNAESVVATANVVPLRPLDEDTLWPVMAAAFTVGNPDRIPPFSKVLAEFVRRQLGLSVPDEVFRQEYVPVAQLRSIYDDLVRMVTELAEALPESGQEKPPQSGQG